MRVAVFGLGYVGTVTAAGLASRGHEVVGVDVDTLKVDAISRGESPVVEPGIDTLVREAVAAGRLQATTDARLAIERADVSLVCVGTPSSEIPNRKMVSLALLKSSRNFPSLSKRAVRAFSLCCVRS